MRYTIRYSPLPLLQYLLKGNGNMKIKLNIIVTEKCNAFSFSPTSDSPGVCKFCFRPQQAINTSNQSWCELLDIIDSNEVENLITFSGGEPFLSSELPKMLKSTKERGFRVALHTNGILLEENLSLLEYIDIISLPYDGHTSNIQDYYRGCGFHKLNKRNFELLKHCNILVGVNTLCTPKNVDNLDEIARFLVGFENIDYWFIKKYMRINSANTEDSFILDEYYLSDNVYTNATYRIKARYPRIHIFTSDTQRLNMPFTIYLHADGNAYIYEKGYCGNIYVGNILKIGFAGIIKKATLSLRSETLYKQSMSE